MYQMIFMQPAQIIFLLVYISCAGMAQLSLLVFPERATPHWCFSPATLTKLWPRERATPHDGDRFQCKLDATPVNAPTNATDDERIISHLHITSYMAAAHATGRIFTLNYDLCVNCRMFFI
jgi:hypothetical protein